MGGLAVEVFPTSKTRKLRPKIRKTLPRQQIKKPTRTFSPRIESARPTSLPSRLTQTVNPKQPRHRLDTAQIELTATTDISTAVRDLRINKMALSQAEAETAAGRGTRGLEMVDRFGVQRTHNHSLLGAFEDEISSDGMSLNLNLDGTGRKLLSKVNFGQVMGSLARQIVKSNKGGPIDVVFVIDSSGSMGDNIRAVRQHLREMIDVYKSAKIDYALGLTTFWAPAKPPRNMIKVSQLTKRLSDYKRELDFIRPRKDENALDAIEQTVQEMRFRPTSRKHLILVTDEPFTSLKGLTLDAVIALCREFYISTNVLGLENDEHRKLARETGGSWHAIPEDPADNSPNQRLVKARRSRYHRQILLGANWKDVAEIGKALLRGLDTNVVDIVLFLDSSKSMEEKLPQFLKQLEKNIRDWDNSLIDYQIGVVRFNTGTGTVNFVNVYHPPQTLEQIRKIAALPRRGNEHLLDAVVEGLRRVKLRPEAQPYLIIVTDEPSTGQYSPEAVIQLCLEKGARVSVVGTFDKFQQQVTTETNGIWVPMPDGRTTNETNW